ncbi:MAG: hypothetical protein KAT58_01385 [candidate division Zixibacteria bacterium]|nr:hypothetical protein [candidate division Zixibacteria bacterium]
MKRLLLILLLVAFRGVYPLDLTEEYQPGEVVRFSLEKKDKTAGTQDVTCLGWQVIENESLYVFQMKSTTRLTQAGRGIDIVITSQAGYLADGRPRDYQYQIDVLGRTVKHRGGFTGKDYFGSTTRFGVDQPFLIPTTGWPILFDSNFGLQWEIVARGFTLEVGDSMILAAMIPQLDTLVNLKVTALPSSKYLYDGKQLPVRVYRIDPVNQLLYIDQQGRLLRAYDTVERNVVRRLSADQVAEISSEPLFDTLFKRLPVYALIFAFGLAWLLVLARRRLMRLDVIALLLLGGILYWPSLKLVTYVALLFERYLASPFSPQAGSYLILFVLALLIALGEELTKFVLIWLRTIIKSVRDSGQAVALGAAVGAGFGLVQAAYLTNFAPDGSILVTADLFQRFFVIGVNAGTGALIGLLLVARKQPLYFLIPLGIKTILGWLFAFVQKGVAGADFYHLTTAVICVATLVTIYLLYRYLPQLRTRALRREKK